MQNHFELFHLTPQFAVDPDALSLAYRQLQQQVHPDKFAAATDSEKRVAMQWATRANEAYQTLKDPLKRAQYLCEMHGVDLQVETNTAMPIEFLMQQMEWREALQKARTTGDSVLLIELERALDAQQKNYLQQAAALLDARDFTGAAAQIRVLIFLQKSKTELELVQQALDD